MVLGCIQKRRCCEYRNVAITRKAPLMTSHPFSQLVRYKQWADRGLYDVVAENLDQLDAQDVAILLRILDHIHVVDKVFQHHL
jgi:hypothetical protein